MLPASLVGSRALATLAHELGHVLGFEHTGGQCSLMFPVYDFGACPPLPDDAPGYYYCRWIDKPQPKGGCAARLNEAAPVLRDGTRLLVVNHEYTSETLMFPGYDPVNPTRPQVETAWAAHGLSVVAVRENSRTGALRPIVGHKLNRRLHTTSEFALFVDDLLQAGTGTLQRSRGRRQQSAREHGAHLDPSARRYSPALTAPATTARRPLTP